MLNLGITMAFPAALVWTLRRGVLRSSGPDMVFQTGLQPTPLNQNDWGGKHHQQILRWFLSTNCKNMAVCRLRSNDQILYIYTLSSLHQHVFPIRTGSVMRVVSPCVVTSKNFQCCWCCFHKWLTPSTEISANHHHCKPFHGQLHLQNGFPRFRSSLPQNKTNRTIEYCFKFSNFFPSFDIDWIFLWDWDIPVPGQHVAVGMILSHQPIHFIGLQLQTTSQQSNRSDWYKILRTATRLIWLQPGSKWNKRVGIQWLEVRKETFQVDLSSFKKILETITLGKRENSLGG